MLLPWSMWATMQKLRMRLWSKACVRGRSGGNVEASARRAGPVPKTPRIVAMPDSSPAPSRVRPILLGAAAVLWLFLAGLRLSQGFVAEPVAMATIAAGFGTLATTKARELDTRSLIGNGLFLVGMVSWIALSLSR